MPVDNANCRYIPLGRRTRIELPPNRVRTFRIYAPTAGTIRLSAKPVVDTADVRVGWDSRFSTAVSETRNLRPLPLTFDAPGANWYHIRVRNTGRQHLALSFSCELRQRFEA